MFICLLASAALSSLAAIITILVHLPINAEIASWDISAIDRNYLEALGRWRTWNTVRLVVLLGAMGTAFEAMLRSGSSNRR